MGQEGGDREGVAKYPLLFKSPGNEIDRTGMVLIIDDERLVREALGELLQAAGFATLGAASGWEGVERFRQYQAQIEAIILDVRLPDLSGVEVINQLGLGAAAVKIIVISGLNPGDVRQRFAGKGVKAFLAKPFAVSALISLLQG
jgi:two-component system cell cycle sensor histidine kinase/response regulator CckA